ncbi:E3 ubiquitin-protein ligase rnf213-alpha isoform X4 [Narcine bancroftii]|uniref:E3 ubiquitin-protein ligase rnf213-alpha isoform X4 n=1 Tax=Narcine bancroftii TaxID=1343680 RepID=UPI0038312284
MAQKGGKQETPNLSTSEDVNLMLSSAIQPATENAESFQGTGNACKIHCDQNPDMSANSENETSNSQRKEKQNQSSSDTCKETIQPKQFHLEGEQTDTATGQVGDVDKETDGADYLPEITNDTTDLQGTVGDGHLPTLAQEDQDPKSNSSVKDESNQGLVLSEDRTVEHSAKAIAVNSVLHQCHSKTADSTGDGILTPEKQKSGNESAKEGKTNGATATNEENTHNQEDLKKKGIPQTKGQSSKTDNEKNLIQQHDSKTMEKKSTDNTSERPNQESTEESTTSTNNNTSTNEDKKTLSRKKKKQQKKHSKEVPSRFSNSKPEENVLIHFYAILSDDFKLNPSRDKVFIRSGTLAGDWKINLLEMNVVKKLEHHGYFMEGKCYVHKNMIEKKHPYKYVVKYVNKEVYEFIYKWDSPVDCITNRCLAINQNLLDEREWHQYDDIICAPSEKNLKNLWEVFKNKKKETKKGKHLACKIMLESILDTLTTWDERNLNNFLLRLQHLFAVYEHPMVFEQMPVNWSSLNFGRNEVQDNLKNILSKMVTHPNQDSANSVQSRLQIGILTLYLTYNYSLEWSDSEMAAVCDIFSVQQFPANIVENEVNTLKKTFCFGNGILVTVKQIIVQCIEHQIINWVHMIPVFHLFEFPSNVTRPGILVSSHSEDIWDGLEGLPVVTFQQNIDVSKQRKLLELMGKNMHLMAVDKLLARSWFSLLPWPALPEYMEIISPDLFDTLHGIIQRLKYGCISHEKSLNHILELAEKNLNNPKRNMCDGHLQACMKAIVNLHEIICKTLKKVNFIDVIASSLALMSKLAALIKSSSKFADDKSQNEEDSEMPYLRMMLTTTRQWLKVVLDSKLLTYKTVSLNQDEFQVWVTLITLDFGNKKWTSFWSEGLMSDLEGRMKKEKPDHQIIIYCKIFEEAIDLHPLITGCFEKCALEAAHSMCQDKSEAQLLNKLANYDLTKFGKLLSAIIENSWEKDYSGMFLEDHDSVIQHLLNWTAARSIFQLHGMNSKVIEGLSNKAKDLIALTEETFDDVMSKLWEGTIKIKHLECILKKKSKFIALYRTKQITSFTDKGLHLLLNRRQNELNRFHEEIKYMESFLKMCRKVEEYVKVAIEDLEKLVTADVCSMKLSEVVTIKQITSDDLESDFAKISYFSLSEEIKEKARSIHTFESSYILQKCWEKRVLKFCAEDRTVEDNAPLSLENVCSVIWEPCFDQYMEIFEKVKEASITFAEVDDIFKDYRDRYDDLRSDLKIMCRIDRNMKDDWIEKRIQQIMEYHHLHSAVESAQVIKKIQSVLNLMGNFTVLETLLKVMDESYRDGCLECIDDQLIQAKTHLHKTKPCIEALKELAQRQQFVQWIKEALKDVNELKVFVDLASISAGENDLDVDRVACFHDAVLGYSPLLFEIHPTAGFPDFIHYLQKLQKALKNDPHLIKKLRDSARHLEWLKTVKESHGSIEQSSLVLASAINNSGIYNISSHGKNKLSLGSVIILNLPKTYDDKEEVRSYTLEDLKELQNKLMLMSGKGDHCQEEVDRFVEVFANVQRFAASFISLFSAGNMLFRNLKVEVHCSQKHEACIIMDFHLKKVGNIKATGDVTEQLPILCKKIETYLEVWKQYMDQHRSRYYYLNFYTAEQIVYLSTQLFDCNCHRQDVLMMLSFIKPNCTAKDIKVAQQRLFHGDAIRRNKPLTDCVQPFTTRQENIQGLATEIKVDLLWKDYMENMTYFLSSCLDISTLGQLLEIIADSKETVTRVFAPGFQKGQPNLVVCPHSDVLTSALCVYLHSSDQPLPTFDEVLLCTAETTYEQVEVFLRRCLTAGCIHSKIYSLLYADQLTYDISVRFEELFKSLELTSQSDYKLVIFCNNEREHCYIPTAFSRHKVHMIPQEPLEKIQSYLENHYKVSTDSSAANILRDGMFVRIISSKRAGVGKSLYVKRLHEKLMQQTREKNLLKTVHILDTQVDENKVLQALFTFIKSSNGNKPLIFHFDITSSVQKGLCEFLFKLFILQYLMGTDEKMWKCSQRHLYIVEMLEGSGFLRKKQTRQKLELFQDLLLSGVPLRETIARNSALKENVFMMVICIELKIPLFLVGKPGSSKSLAKTIVADAMQGQASHSELYKKLKQIHLVSFQCSPHSTSEGIINTFKQCARFQEGKNLDEYVSVVVLDEIGLAEDTPKMPLKTLHPLLEDGCIDDDQLKHKKVGFIGISNWALDPAKMNRGVFVSRGDPDRKELIESAKGISSSDPMIQNKMIGLFVNFAEVYLRICEQQSKEFFGLRDYYSLIKMVFSLAKVSKSEPTPEQLAEVVLRNFSGSDDVKVMEVFKSVLKNISHESIKTMDLIRHNIYADSHEMECRYVLILTKNFAALQILQQMFFSNQHQPEIIFGSSFPKDQDYTQICRNINRVKICMETGQMIVLLNLQNLYESLYDALNQYYVYLGGQKYVDLGLGTHRVKCRVHSNFRLMVIEEKEVVYREFPIPLINRLEKHYLDINTVLNKDQRQIVTCLEKWVKSFTVVRSSGQQRYDPPDVFVGYHSDTCSSVVLQIMQRLKQTPRSWEVILKEAQWVLLNCATPDSVFRLAHSQLPAHEADVLMQQYFEEHHHNSLEDFIQSHIKSGVPCWAVFTEVTTYSRLLTSSDIELLQDELGDSVQNIFLYSLQQFDTEHSFLKKIRHCIDYSPQNTILLIQTDFENSSQSANLIASAKYSTLNEISKNKRDNRTIYVYFLTKLSRIEGGSAYRGFQGDPWQSVHIDDLRKSKDMFADMTAFKDIPISQLFGRDSGDPEPMIVNQKEAIFDKTKILDTTILIRNCVQSAVGMLRDQHQHSNRNTTRVEILLSLLREDVEFKASFLALMKQRLHSLLLKRDAKSNNPTEWLIRVASNVEALQEGGTFRHTLWKRIQTVVTPLMAQIISVIDRDGNLNLLSDDTPTFVLKLWIFFLKNENLLDLPYHRTTLSLQSEIVVYNYMKMEILNVTSRFPFSWRMKDFLDDLWVQAQYMEGQNQHKLNEIFNKTGFGKYLSNMKEEWRQDLFFRYVHDFLLMSTSISSEAEFEFLQGALISCINQLKIESNIGDDASLLWVHFAYQQFKNRLQNFSRIVVIQPSVLTLLQKKKDEIQNAEDKEMVIDIYAAAACVEILEFENSELSYPTWLQMVNSLQMPIELVSAEVFSHGEGSKSYIANYVKSGWRRILSLSLFVEHIILGAEEMHVDLPNKAVFSAHRLAKSLNSDSDVRSQGPFRAVIEVLRDCKNSAGRLFFRYGLKGCLICLGELNNPVMLPCNHLYCLNCINMWFQTGQRNCPMLCSNDLDKGYVPVASEEIREAVAKLAVFRRKCDAFFIALVSMVCFKDNSPPTKEVVDDLFSLMIVQKNLLPSNSKKDQQFFTSNLSPFDDTVDRNPVVRSIVLKLLLKYSFDDIKDHMQVYLSEVQKTNIFGKENETKLYALFLNCLEDSIYEKSQLFTVKEKIAYLAQEEEFLLMFFHHESKLITVETLQIFARIRLCLDTAAQLLCEKCDTLAQDLKQPYISAKEKFLLQIKDLAQRQENGWFKIYLVRKICSLNGIEFVQELSMDNRFSWIFPHEIILQRHSFGQIDRYLACGINYQKFRDAVTNAFVTGELKSIEEVQKGCKYSSNEQRVYVTLAIFREITMLYSTSQQTIHSNKDKCDMIEKYIENENLFPSGMSKNFVIGLFKNGIPGLEINSAQKSQDRMIVELIVHAAAVLLNGDRNGILAPLQNLSFQPAEMVKAFLPTMPEDMMTEARKWGVFETVRWYQCPNGHPCAIGECGQPVVKSYCIECKAEIGGLHHKPVHGFTCAPRDDKTQTGHILGDPNKRETIVALDKQMPLVSFLLMRLMTHVALFLGTTEDKKSIKLIIQPSVENPRVFLWRHIEKDIEQLKKSLEKTIDETAIVVHLILSQLIKQKKWPPKSLSKLSTKQERNSWEDFISNEIITPTIKDLDVILGNLNRLICQDERICSNILVKTVYNDPQTFLKLPKKSPLHCSSIWCCRKRISTEHLRHLVEQKDVKDSVPILQKFLQKEPQLRLVKYLPEILALQYDLVKLFQNALEVPKQSIHEFLQTFRSELVKSTYTSRISGFIYVWNQLRTFLFSNGEMKIPEEYCALDLDMQNCQLEVLLPRRQGLGLCSTALVSYLIALQNDMVYAVVKYTPESTLYSVSPQDVSELHVIRYEIGKDMIPLLSSNCQYTVEKGSEMVIEYDFNSIEQQLTNRFLKGKPLIILKGVPTLIYRQDRNYEIIFEDIKNKIVQESLPVSVINAISVELQSYNEVCEAFNSVEVTVGFLAMSGGDRDLELVVYLKEVLQMEAQTAPHVMDALRRCRLKHIQALWQLLSSRKSESLLLLNRDPFSGIKEQYKTVLSGETKKQLRAFFIQASVDIFILELHEMLILKCKNVQTSDYFDPSWSLKVCLGDYNEQDNLPELEDHFPETISMSESVETWKAAVAFKREQSQFTR